MTGFTCNLVFTKLVFTNSFFWERNILRQKKVNIFWIFIKKSCHIGYFSQFRLWQQLPGNKKVHGYLISFEPQMIRSSYKEHLSKLSRLFKSYMLIFWRLLKVFGDKNLEISHQDLKTFYSYATNLSCEIIRENLHAIFAFSNNSSTCSKSQILFLVCKIYAWRHF